MKRNKSMFSALLAFLLAVVCFLPAAPEAAALSLFQKIPDPQESLGAELNQSLPALTNVCGYPVTLPTGEMLNALYSLAAVNSI